MIQFLRILYIPVSIIEPGQNIKVTEMSQLLLAL